MTKKALSVKKENNFNRWYNQVIKKAEIIDLRLNTKGFVIIRPWGTQIIERMYNLYEKELQKKGHKPVIFPSVIPESNLKKEEEHIKGFTPEVFWLKTKGEENLALRPTSETVFTPMFALWIRSHRDLPMKLYQRGSVYRYDTKSIKPLIRGREFNWIEAHDAFATKEQAEKQVQEDIQTTEDVMHKKFGIPFLAMKRPQWDKFAGAEYTIGSDVLMPNGKLIQQPSTHLMGQKFAKAFDAKFKNENGEEEYIWTTAYGPAMSRILASLISVHGDDKGLVLPFCLSPLQIVIIPIYTTKNKDKIIKYCGKIKNKLAKYRTYYDDREYTPGWKFHEWELKGVPFRLEIGEKEMKNKEATLFIRDINKKQKIKISELTNIQKLGKEFDARLLKKADNFMKNKIVNCKNKKEITKALNENKIAKVNFCSVDKQGEKCAEHIEKDLNAEIRGILANKKETPKGKCIICEKTAKEVVYIGKSY